MDMESDMCDSDMDMPGIFRLMMIIRPSLNCIANKIRGEVKKGAGRDESVQSQ